MVLRHPVSGTIAIFSQVLAGCGTVNIIQYTVLVCTFGDFISKVIRP
jgi:hypothetical protein